MGKYAEAYRWLMVMVVTTGVSFFWLDTVWTLSFFIAGMLMTALALIQDSLQE